MSRKTRPVKERQTDTPTPEFQGKRARRQSGPALLCGVPVVGSSSGEIPWVIGTSGGGRTIPEGDPAALAAVLTELHESPSIRAELARHGAAGVEQHFSPRVAPRELDRLIRSVL